MFTPFLPWIRFLRLPAVLTVPGDVWVGAAVAGKEISIPLTLSVALVYLYGMACNDLVDAARDREQRPERPIPAGEIDKTAAVGLCFMLGCTAYLLHPGLPLLALLGLVTLYNFLKNAGVWLGGLLMSTCRMSVLWIGAGAPGHLTGLWPFLLLWGLLILSITLLADKENQEDFAAKEFSLALTLYWLAAPLLALSCGHPRFLVFLPWALLTVLALQNFRQISRQDQLIPRNTGQWLSMLIPLQAAFLVTMAPVWQGILILALWPCLRWSVRKMQIS